MTGPLRMMQEADMPLVLHDLVSRLEYRRGWSFSLETIDRGQGSHGLTLSVLIHTQDSYDQDKRRSVVHYMIVPAAAFNEASWQRWLFDQILLVETHEAMEFFSLRSAPGSKESVKPYAPNHGEGEDPYIVHDLATDEQRRTSFRNVLDDDGTGNSRTNVPNGRNKLS
jgi:hypothetical protein